MGTYIILSKVSTEAFQDPKDFKKLAEAVIAKTNAECPGVTFKASYTTLGRWDIVDIVEADDPRDVQKVAMYIRGYAHSDTETLVAMSWEELLASL